MDTAEPIVLLSDAAPDAPVRQRRGPYWWVWAAIGLGLVIVLLLSSVFVTLPYFALSPGTASPINQQMEVPKDLNYPPKGQFLLTTVSLQRVRPLEALHGWLDKDIDVVPEEQILGTTKNKDFRQQNVQEMDDSILVAEVVALRKLGYKVTEHGAGALVVSVADKSPADGHIKAGDVVTSIDGKPVALGSDLVAALAGRHFGDTVKLNVTTDGQSPRAETIKLGGANADKSVCSIDKAQTGNGCLGIALGTKSHTYDRPIDVKINPNGIGGPSAGLAFVLAIMDQLRPGELSGGHKIAVTGTISIDGTVGDVGGVKQKTAAVRHAHAEYFLVPPGEFKEASAHAGSHLKVIKVSTLDQALQVLQSLGGTIY
jgi:PDZ domain-containing protein